MVDENGRVRIGLIGTGGIALPHLTGYLAAPELAQVTALADVDADRLAERAGRVPTPTATVADYRELLARGDVDAVDICLPHHLHAEVIVAAAEAGKHVLCEKPLCLNLDEAERITAAVETAGITLMCSHNQLYLPPVARARELIADGALGEVYEIRTTDSFYNNFDPSTMGWRAERSKIGGGELIDTGYHPTYLMRFLADDSPTEVTALLARHRLSFMDGEDSAQVLIRFASGVIGHIVTSWAYQAAGCTERFSAVGSEGQLWSDGSTLWVRPRGGEAVAETFPDPTSGTIPLAVQDFARHVAAGTRPLHTQVEGIEVLRIILGAYASAERRATVELAEL